jgi:hypothetical protein
MDKSNGFFGQRISLTKLASVVGWYLNTSDIEGQGLFANRDYKEGDVIELAMYPGGKDEYNNDIYNLTTAARYTNHQFNSNSKIVKEGDNYNLVASKPILEDDEITANYAEVTRTLGPKAVMHWQGEQVPSVDLHKYKERNLRNESDSDGQIRSIW